VEEEPELAIQPTTLLLVLEVEVGRMHKKQ
jgi:hypothetical protein